MNANVTSQCISELLFFADTHRRHEEALARATGEYFNIFKILGIGHYEVLTHSPMLGNLLNPKGSHGQGDVFLRIFVNVIGITNFATSTARLHLESYIGRVTDKSGGRIDIVISDQGGNFICVENKIYAGDQENQMQRYRKRYPQAHLLYLTLNGSMPSGFTEEKLNAIGVTRISYETHIRDWLAACVKEAASLPHVRESLSQYLHLIKELTAQGTLQTMNQELIEKVTAGENVLGAYFALTSALDKVKEALWKKLQDHLDEAAKDADLLRDNSLEKIHLKYPGIYFTNAVLKKYNLRIGFAFNGQRFQDLDFGFMRIDKAQPCDAKGELLRLFREEFHAFPPKEPTEWWPAWADFEPPYGNWDTEAFQAIVSRQLAKNMKEKLIVMSKIAKQVCPD